VRSYDEIRGAFDSKGGRRTQRSISTTVNGDCSTSHLRQRPAYETGWQWSKQWSTSQHLLTVEVVWRQKTTKLWALSSVYKSLHDMEPEYLAELCRPISDVQGRRHLRSAARELLLTPRYYLSTYGWRAFPYAGPSAWNSLPEHLQAPDLTLNSFRHLLKTFLFTQMTHAAH